MGMKFLICSSIVLTASFSCFNFRRTPVPTGNVSADSLFVLRGSLSPDFEGDYVTIKILDYPNYKPEILFPDSCEITDNQFIFEGPLSVPTIKGLLTFRQRDGKMRRPIDIAVEKGQQEVEIDRRIIGWLWRLV